MKDEIIRIAMWSGPRNLSTAMMRSFGARSDTFCIDEPFYAAYLSLTGLKHPMWKEIVDHHETDPAKVGRLLAREPVEAGLFYQKHMTHHMIPGIPIDWMAGMKHAFLIRHPARVIASYRNKMEQVSTDALGYSRQLELFQIAETLTGQRPVVIDSDDVLRQPDRLLRALCDALSIPYQKTMLHWRSGPRPEDGVWARHWYDRVYASTGFTEPISDLPQISDTDKVVFDHAREIYRVLSQERLKPA
jgi:hypothetical protein